MSKKISTGNLKKIKQRLIKQKWVLLGFILLTALIYIGKEPLGERYNIIFARSDCLPYKAYFFDKTKPIGTLKTGDIIIGKSVKMAPVLKDGETITKMVKGLPGDTVEIKNGIIRINGQYLDTVFYGAEKQRLPKTHWDTKYTLKDGELFVYGTAENSYDSRYWGTYPQDNVLGIVRPLF